ncbi:MAG: hypothetical protein HYY16_01780 [Planctomycetes bacterium]|nr:hypothetical protein [Planctomycetota bacterium]
MEFVPGVGLKCPYCGHVAGVPRNEDQIIEESSFEEYLKSPRTARGYGADGARQVVCTSCGAAGRLGRDAVSTRCAYCGSPVVVEDGFDDGIVRPEAVVPFQVTQAQALDRFQAWIASLWFAPNELKRLKETDRVAGVYRPYWTFDAATHSFYHGERGDHYWVTEHTTTTEHVDGQTRTVSKSRQARKTRWTSVSGQVSHFFDDLLIAAGRPLGWDTRYNLGGLRPYDPGFLAGWQAERYTLPPERAWPAAKKIVDEEIDGLVREEIGGDEQRVHSVRTGYSAVKFKHILLPLYVAGYFYAGKAYRFQVNGQSGEVKGERPYSFWKIFFLVVGILAALGLVALVVAARG